MSKSAQKHLRRAILDERERLLKTRTSVASVVGYVANVSLVAPSRKRMLDDLQAIGELVVIDLGHNHDRLVAVEAEIGPVLPRRDRERQLREDIEGALELGALRWEANE